MDLILLLNMLKIIVEIKIISQLKQVGAKCDKTQYYSTRTELHQKSPERTIFRASESNTLLFRDHERYLQKPK